MGKSGKDGKVRGKKEEGFDVYVDTLVRRYPQLECVRQDIINAYFLMEACYERDGKLLIAGNGGSAADAEHIAGELMKRFLLPRPVSFDYAQKLRDTDPVIGARLAENLEQGLMAVSLSAHEALSTAYINDVDADSVFAQQILGYGRRGDVFLGISTSGNSSNIIHAAVAAKARGIQVIGLTGAEGGWLASAADAAVKVPETETYKIQELHLPVYHCWCMMLENRFFGGAG